MDQAFSECVADAELAEALKARGELIQLKKGLVLFRQGQQPARLFLLTQGEVVLTCKMADTSIAGLRAAPGSLMGLPAVSGNQPYSMTATATRDSEVCVVSALVFREIIGVNPRLSFRVLELLASEVRSARRLLCTALSNSLRHR